MKQTTLSFTKKGLAINDSTEESKTKEKSKKIAKKALEKIDEGITQQSKRVKEDTSEPIIKEQSSAPKKVKAPPTHRLVDRLYHPIDDAPFDANENVPFSFVVQSIKELKKCKGGNSKDSVKEIVSNVMRSVSLLHPEELGSLFYFYIVKLGPEYKSKETGVGQEILIKAIMRVIGKEEKKIRETKAALGDLGKVFFECKGSMTTMDNFFSTKKKKKITVILFNL